ncbi:Protein-arginine kinase [Ruminococcaceae bacterium YRB3002]|nr:Protein-arginine kinase [Ruminococcaceae bacterium YRB3002]
MSNAKWFERSGRYPEIVLSSKALITRNIKGYNFPGRMSIADKEEVKEKVSNALKDRELTMWEMDKISGPLKRELIDGQIISHKSYAGNMDGQAILTNKDMSVSVMVNHNDHIKIRVQASGFTDEAYRKCEDIACSLEKGLDIAFSSKYGFLTSTTSDTGMGLRLLYTVAIPGIVRTQEGLEFLKNKVAQYGWKMYPFVETDEDTQCDVYIIANNLSMGVDEKTVLDSGRKVIEDVITIEKACRETLLKNNAFILENSFYRSYGILYYSKAMTPPEALDLIEWIRLYHGYENTEEVKIDWDQINNITSCMLWQLVPLMEVQNLRMEPQAVAARIAQILRDNREV